MLKLEVGGGDSRMLLLRDEFRCRIITYSAKIKKEKREIVKVQEREQDRQTHWLYGNYFLLLYTVREKDEDFP